MDNKLEVWCAKNNGDVIGFIPMYSAFIELDKEIDSIVMPDAALKSFSDWHDSMRLMPGDKIRELQLVTTLHCNSGCDYCYAEVEKTKEHLTHEKIIKILEYEDITPEVICIFGGEPLLRPKDLRKMLDGLVLRYGKMKISLSTGLFVSPSQWRDSLMVLSDFDIKVSLTLDNPNDGSPYTRRDGSHGGMDADFLMMKELYDAGIEIEVQSLISRTAQNPFPALRRVLTDIGSDVLCTVQMASYKSGENIPSIEEVDLLESRFTDYIHFLRNSDLDGVIMPSSWATMSGNFSGTPCPSGRSSMAIMPDGTVTNCFSDVRLSENNSNAIEIKETWHDKVNEVCGSCEISGSCKFKCPTTSPLWGQKKCKSIMSALIKPIVLDFIENCDRSVINKYMPAKRCPK